MTSIYEQWIADNRESLVSAVAKQFRTLTDLSSGRVTNEELADSAIDEVQEAASQEADTPAVGSWEAVVEAVNAYAEAEGIVTEGWLLVVEPYESQVRASLDPVHVRVFGNAVSTAHAVGMARMAERRIAVTGVEG
jgi:hypothetical protein